MKYSGEFTVNANDIDMNFIVTVSNLFRYMQDAANYQMEADGPSYNELFANGYSFVLSRICIEIHRPLYSHEKFTVESWACESRGLTYNRCYRISRGDEVIAEATSTWALISLADRKLHKVGEVEMNYGMYDMLNLSLSQRFKIPDSVSLSLVGERTVEYADVDMNGHMNNTKYPDMMCGYIGSMKGKRVVSMRINYASEAPLGETIKIYHGTDADGDTHYIRTMRENGSINVEAEIVTEAI